MVSSAEPPTTGATKSTTSGALRHDRWRSFGIATAVVVVYALLVLTTHGALLTDGVTLGGDARTSYWQDVVFATESLRAGEAPLWNPFERGGYPFSADPQPAIWSPLSWLVYLLGLASGGHGHWLQEIRQLAAPVLAACGVHLFLRRRGLSHPAAGLAGTILVAGAFAQRTITMATYWPWAYLGFILAAIDATALRPSWANGRWLALTLLLLVTSGFPPSIFYALLIAVPYALLRLSGAAGRKPAEGTTQATTKARAQALLAMTGAAVVASLGALVVIVPLLEQTALSWRAERGLDYILSNPASFADLWTLVDPLIRGKELFIGLLGLAMAALALLEIGDRRRRAEVLFWLAITLFGTLLAAAQETPLLALCATYLPGFDLFRIASRYMILTHTGLALLAAYGLDLALRSAARRPSPTAALTLRRRRVLTALAIACLFVQVMDLRRIEVRGRFAAVQETAAGEALAAEIGDARAYNEWTLGPRGGAVFSVRDWRGRSKDPMSFARYQEVEREVSRRPDLLRHFAVEHLLVGGRREVAGRPRLRRPAAIRGTTLEGPYHLRFRAPGPEVYWSGEIVETAAGEGLRELRTRAVGTAVIVDEGELAEAERDLLRRSAEPAPAAVVGDVVDRRRNRLTVTIDAPAAGIVTLAEVWHPGWRAEVDGVPASVHRTNHLLRGVVVGPGAHRIELSYRPRSLPWVTGLYGLAWLLIVVDPRLLRRRRLTGSPPRAGNT